MNAIWRPSGLHAGSLMAPTPVTWMRSLDLAAGDVHDGDLVVCPGRT
jgi:hypothetical protein